MEDPISNLKNYLSIYIKICERPFLNLKHTQDNNEIFKNSMFFIDEKKFEYSILNSLSLLIKKIQQKQNEENNQFNLKHFTIEKFFNNYFLKFCDDCGDFSNLFFIILFQFIDIINENIQKNRKYKQELNEELKKYYHRIVEDFNNLITKYECVLEAESDEFTIKYLFFPITHKLKNKVIQKEILIKTNYIYKQLLDALSNGEETINLDDLIKSISYLSFYKLDENLKIDENIKVIEHNYKQSNNDRDGSFRLYISQDFFLEIFKNNKLIDNQDFVNNSLIQKSRFIFYSEYFIQNDEETDNKLQFEIRLNAKQIENRILKFIQFLKEKEISAVLIIDDSISCIYEKYFDYFFYHKIILFKVKLDDQIEESLCNCLKLNVFDYTILNEELGNYNFIFDNRMKFNINLNHDAKEVLYLTIEEQHLEKSRNLFNCLLKAHKRKYFLLESSIKEFSDIAKFYIARLLITIRNHLSNERKYLEMNKIFNQTVIEEFIGSLNRSDCKKIQTLFEALMERLALRYSIFENDKKKKYEAYIESFFKM